MTEALNHARRDARNPNWIHVTRALRMACTSRLCRGLPHGVRIGERAKVDVDIGDYQWLLPDTEEQWKDLEEKWRSRVPRPSAEAVQSLKHRPRQVSEGEEQDEREQDKTPTKAELVRDKVRAWQANVIHVGQPTAMPEVNDVVTGHDSPQNNSGTSRKKQSPIEFPVAKMSAIASTSKPTNGKNSSESLAKAYIDTTSLKLPGQAPVQPALPPISEAVRINDLSEMVIIHYCC